jgi:hypothetical protein
MLYFYVWLLSCAKNKHMDFVLTLTICFPERAGGNVVECACLIGLPKFKVLYRLIHSCPTGKITCCYYTLLTALKYETFE